MNLLEEYLREMHEIRLSGSAVKETSYHPALSDLLNGVGKGLKPRDRRITNLKNRSAGIPDEGLFSAGQYLNDRVCWRNISSRLWDFTISGYAVIKKRLSYREKELLGRSLSVDEARYVTETARPLAVLMLMGPQLDENYRAVVKGAHKW